jgi:hypothetical protein
MADCVVDSLEVVEVDERHSLRGQWLIANISDSRTQTPVSTSVVALCKSRSAVYAHVPPQSGHQIPRAPANASTLPERAGRRRRQERFPISETDVHGHSVRHLRVGCGHLCPERTAQGEHDALGRGRIARMQEVSRRHVYSAQFHCAVRERGHTHTVGLKHQRFRTKARNIGCLSQSQHGPSRRRACALVSNQKRLLSPH